MLSAQKGQPRYSTDNGEKSGKGKLGKGSGKARKGKGKGGQQKPKGMRASDEIEIKDLENRILIECPRTDESFDKWAERKFGESQVVDDIRSGIMFTQLPLSKRTSLGLKSLGFVEMTKIQSRAIPFALAGRDILGEAKTGSGKTLAFLIPLLELLFRKKWTKMDGLGALVVIPTRELAAQVFQVFGEVGQQHELSCGCVVGGRNFEGEQATILGMNIVVATPGRLRQHVEETPGFELGNLQMFVIDEADRILDLGFRKEMQTILEALPPPGERQTLLFSATLKNTVQQLVSISLNNPELVSVSTDTAPSKLKQMVMTVPLEKKVDSLFSFLRSHSQKKLVVFVSSCKQVRFLYEALRRVKVGCQVMELHGKQSIDKRMMIFDSFSRKDGAVALICTDVAARGVDFPAVDWVIQMDCPDTLESYVHRVGRTARYGASGSSLLFLTPQEAEFAKQVKDGGLDMQVVKASTRNLYSCQTKLQCALASDRELKYLAQRAFVSYMRSVFILGRVRREDLTPEAVEEVAKSFGLSMAPEIPHDSSEKRKKLKNMTALERLREKIKAKREAKRMARQETIKKEAENKLEDEEKVEEGSEDELLVPVKSQRDDRSGTLETTTAEKRAQFAIKKQRLKFRKDGTVHVRGTGGIGGDAGGMGEKHKRFDSDSEAEGREEASQPLNEERGKFEQAVKSLLEEREEETMLRERQRVQTKHRKRKLRSRETHEGAPETRLETVVEHESGSNDEEAPFPGSKARRLSEDI